MPGAELVASEVLGPAASDWCICCLSSHGEHGTCWLLLEDPPRRTSYDKGTRGSRWLPPLLDPPGTSHRSTTRVRAKRGPVHAADWLNARIPFLPPKPT